MAGFSNIRRMKRRRLKGGKELAHMILDNVNGEITSDSLERTEIEIVQKNVYTLQRSREICIEQEINI